MEQIQKLCKSSDVQTERRGIYLYLVRRNEDSDEVYSLRFRSSDFINRDEAMGM